ncbi:hypothetical protein C900_01910 [Fulvivirga imtechensis AK7]|uniref:UspA domain-containing protein n=1 Tax=Fulvivirga imtechensis AK7 TaxID=1237149 RepID=L8JT81_9BACT|nr:universal stress protein [Fulvivirga imtechensis]ELR72045.1 hypothetical protein C900_01910 [Fulvivirga imtechensis AK7]
MRRKLIVLIDFSSYSEPLVKFALNWANELDLDLVFVHQITAIVPAMTDNESRLQIVASEKNDALTRLRLLVQKYNSGKLMPQYQVTDKPLRFYLPHLLADRADDLIMAGLKGTGILKRVFLGSTVAKIIEELDYITVAMPGKISGLIPRHMTIAVNYRYPANENALTSLIGLMLPSLVKIELISIVTSADDEAEVEAYLKKLQQRLPENITSAYHLYNGKDAFSMVKSHCVTQVDTVLVVQKGSRTLKDHLFRRFFVNELVYDGSIPLIVLPL